MEAWNDCAETYDDEADEMINQAQQIGWPWDVRGPGTTDSETIKFSYRITGTEWRPREPCVSMSERGRKTTGGQNEKDQSPCLNFHWFLFYCLSLKMFVHIKTIVIKRNYSAFNNGV